MSIFMQAREEVLKAAITLVEKGLLVGSGGNISMRLEGEDAVAITPSSVDYEILKTKDICIIDFARQPLEGELAPSVEAAMHLAVYEQRADVNAVIHTHQIFASALGLVGKPIPALTDEQVGNLGSAVELVPYAMSGSPELKESIAGAVISNNNSYLLENHGALVLGMTLRDAVRNVALLEKISNVYWQTILAGLKPRLLPEQSKEAVFSLLRSKQQKEIRRKRRLAKKRGLEKEL